MKALANFYFFAVSLLGTVIIVICSILLINQFVDHWFLKRFYISKEKNIAYAQVEGLIDNNISSFPDDFDSKLKMEYSRRSYDFEKFYVKIFFILIISLVFTLVHLFLGLRKKISS